MTTTATEAPGRVASRHARRGSWLGWLVIAIVAIAAAAHIPFPFWGDQALFTYAAHGMRHGDRLYVDFWDYKQPGIFLWYLGAGSVFGFHEAGMHVAELIWSVALAVGIQRVMRSRVQHRWVADVAPLLTVGAFYAAARAWDLTQIEYLVALPLLLSLWAAAAADTETGTDGRRTRLLAMSGVMAAVVVYFKLVYVLVPVTFWVFLLIDRRRRERARDTRRDIREASVLVGALAVPLLPLLVYFVSEHLLGTMWWTYVTYPPKIVRTIDPPPFSRLRDGVWFFVRNFAWLGALSIPALMPRSRTGARRDPLKVGLVIWFVVGWATVLIQNQWGYQFMLPLIPLGLLAAYGLDRAAGANRRNATIALAVVAALLALYPVKQAAHTVKELARDDFALSSAGRHKFEATFEPYYPEARAAAAFVRAPGRTPGAIHVEGNPLIQYLSGRPFALREHGWAPEQSDARLWKWTRDGLRKARPAYLWVDDFSLDIMRARSPETLALVDSMYCRVVRIADGAWYALHGSRECRAA